MTEQARYEVRTPMALWLTNGVLVAYSSSLVTQCSAAAFPASS